MDSKNKYLYILSGGAIATAFVGALYAIWKKVTKVRLSDWLEEYLKEIEEMIKKNKDADLTVDIIGHIFQAITETEDYLYLQQYSDLEEERVSMIGNDQQYRMLFAETLETRNEFYEKATQLVEQRLKITMMQLDEVLKKHTAIATKEVLRRARKPYNNLPEASSSTVREAFIYYVKQRKANDQFAQEQLYIMNINPDYRTRAMANIYYMKNKLKDEIKSKFKVDDKYLEQLIEKHDLLKDTEVKYYVDELRLLE